MFHKIIIIIAVLFTLYTQTVSGQNTKNPDSAHYEKPYPSYNFVGYISHNIKYPKSARDNGVQGVVKVKFIINVDGTISGASVVQHLDDACDSEAVKAVNNMPAWNPAMQDGKPIRIYFTEPVSFKLK